MPSAWMTVITPKAVPRRDGSTIRVVEGQMIAGTSAQLMPISTVETHGFQSVRPSTARVSGNRTVPKHSKSAR